MEYREIFQERMQEQLDNHRPKEKESLPKCMPYTKINSKWI